MTLQQGIRLVERQHPVRRLYIHYGRRVFDFSVLILTHVLLLPLWLLAWITIPLAIYIDSGSPIFYKTIRVGHKGDRFPIFKFRTMVDDADELGPSFTIPDDPRITSIGAILRQTALDELPQLLAIVRGDMSFVGPRAYGTSSHKLYANRDPSFEARLAIRPGLTGLAAVYGDPEDPHNRLRLDLEYIERASPWLDLKLLLASARIALNLDWERKQPISANTQDQFFNITDKQ